jgi:acyl carrier protein
VADRAEVLGKVQEILVERLDVDPADIVESAHMRDDLQADSLDLVELIMDLEEINSEFPTCYVALIIGAIDVVNPVARTDKSTPARILVQSFAFLPVQRTWRRRPNLRASDLRISTHFLQSRMIPRSDLSSPARGCACVRAKMIYMCTHRCLLS